MSASNDRARPRARGRTPRVGVISLSAATACVVACGLAAPAYATAPTVGFGSVRLDPQEYGNFSLPVWTDAAGATVDQVTATILDAGQAVTTVALTKPHNDGIWQTATPLKLASDGGTMPHLGDYTISITATDTATDTLTRADDGTLHFQLRPVFANENYNGQLVNLHVVTPATHDHHAVALTGQVEGYRPGTSTPDPITDGTVRVSQFHSSTQLPDATQDVTPGSDGTFTTAEFSQPSADTYYTAAYTPAGADEPIPGLGAETSQVTSATPVVLTVSAGQHRVVEGHTFTVSGYARQGSTTNSPPAANVPIDLGMDLYDAKLPPTVVTTDANGHFSGSLVAIASNYSDSFWTAAAEGPYWYSPTVQSTIAVASEGLFRDVSIRLSNTGLVSSTAILGKRFYGDNRALDGQVAELQYSPNGRTGWRRLTRMTTDVTQQVTLSAYAPAADGYYRLAHAESDELAATTTSTVRLHRTVTSVYGQKASARTLKKGQKLTLTGTLRELVGRTWRPCAHQIVHLDLRVRGSSKFYYYSVGTTDAHGRITLSSTVGVTGDWVLLYIGDGTHFSSSGPLVRVTVR